MARGVGRYTFRKGGQMFTLVWARTNSSRKNPYEGYVGRSRKGLVEAGPNLEAPSLDGLKRRARWVAEGMVAGIKEFGDR